MLPAEQQCNEPLAPAQVAVLQKNISSRQKDLHYIESVIQQEEAKSAANAAAIAHLDPAISRAQRAIAVQKEVLVHLRDIQNKLEAMNDIAGPNWTEDSSSKELCESAMTRVDGQISNGVEIIACQISKTEEYITTLQSALYELELEIYSNRLTQDSSMQYISGVQDHRDTIEGNIRLLKLGLSPTRNTPAEIWAKIFSVCVCAEMETYFANPVGQLIPSIALNLSHVCRFWRRIVSAERRLWQFVAIYPTTSWIPSKVELLKYHCLFSPDTSTLVYNLTQATTWTNTATQYDPYIDQYNLPARYMTAIGTSEASMFQTYSLRVLAYGQSNGNIPNHIPFLHPKCLTLQLLNEPNNAHVTSILSPFNGITSLELISASHYSGVQLGLSTTHRQITSLKLDLTTFQTLDLTGYLGPNLTELHINHNGANTFAPLPATIRLPKLKILGITPPDTEFTQTLQLPGLTRVILYAPKLSSIGAVSFAQFTNARFFKKVQELELQNWRLSQPDGGAGPWDVMTAMNGVVESMRNLAVLRCIDSHLDGARFITFVQALKDTTDTLGESMLETIVVNCCSGVTRDECETIGGLVSKMEIYV